MANENKTEAAVSAASAPAAGTAPAKLPPGSMRITVGDLTMRTNIEGIGFDFNMGARVRVPKGDWRVRLTDLDTANVVYDQKVSDITIASKKKYFIRWRIEVFKENKIVFAHDLDLKNKRVLFKNVSDALGDTLAWIPYAREFKKKHGCEIYYAMSPLVAEILKNDYSEINFIAPDERPEGLYASYYLGCFSPHKDRDSQPTSWHTVGLQRNVAYILGLEPKEIRTVITPTNKERVIKEPYVCIAAQASAQSKYWNNAVGWMDVNKFLKEQGYRVLCIDRERTYGPGYKPNTIPWGSEDFTGNIPLAERVNMIQHADFFIGLSSGLSWVAWAVGKPVVMISGVTLPEMEFYTPYRIINYNVCTGCFNDDEYDFDHGNFLWCPRHDKDSDSRFECTRAITAHQVITAIKRLMTDYHFAPNERHKKNNKGK